MSDKMKKHLKHEVFISGSTNTFFNGLIAWLLLKEAAPLAWTGEHSFVIDMIATSFILSFIIALIVIAVHKRKLKNGKLDTIDFGEDSLIQKWVNRLPASNLGNALCFGFIGILVATPLPLLGFYLLGIEEIAAQNYAIYKGLWAGSLAAILVIPMVMSALRANVSDTSELQSSSK